VKHLLESIFPYGCTGSNPVPGALFCNEKYLNYKRYSSYNKYSNYKMEITTIALPRELKEKIEEFGSKGESYANIIARLIASARERQLHDLLMNEDETVSIDEALSNAKKRWRK
jgi:predicted CopG family antitoxin